MYSLFDHFWHRTLHRPYRLALSLDQGAGTPVILLHGIGASGKIWSHVADLLARQPYRVVAPDLLGFGASPKPEWLDYSVDDHARMIIAVIERRHFRQPVVLVGHSMGCLVAVRVARLRPHLVKHLILYEMPLYMDLPDIRRYTVRRDLYFKIYKLIIQSPEIALSTERTLRKTIARLAGLEIDKTIWHPFIKSLEYTIMRQTTLQDINQLQLPMDVIYGSLDMVVIRGKPRRIFGKQSTHITTHTITQLHGVSRSASRFIAKRIVAAVEGDDLTTTQQLPRKQRQQKDTQGRQHDRAPRRQPRVKRNK
jgi:pimeloyl-ACP methyl ester carboxylesterase